MCAVTAITIIHEWDADMVLGAVYVFTCARACVCLNVYGEGPNPNLDVTSNPNPYPNPYPNLT